MKPVLKTVSALFLFAFLSPAEAGITVTYWQRDVSVETSLLIYESVSSAATGELDLKGPASPGGGSGQDFELTVEGSQKTTVTQTPNALSILGQGSVSSGATVTYPGNMFSEASVVVNTLFTLTEKAEFSLYGVFSGSGGALDRHLSATLYPANGNTPAAAIGYFQDGTSNLPGSALTGTLEPGDYFFSLSLRTKSTGAPTDDGQVVTESFFGGVTDFAFTVQEIPEPSTTVISAGALAAMGARRRRSAKA